MLSIACIASVSSAEIQTRPAFLVLRQLVISGDNYFIPGGAKFLEIVAASSGDSRRKDVRTKSNVIVFTGDAQFGYPYALIDQWLDLGGHVHTQEILERQASYGRGRYLAEVEMGYSSFPLKRARPAPLDLPYIQPSGALTVDTLLIPMYHLEIDYEREARSKDRGCAPERPGGYPTYCFYPDGRIMPGTYEVCPADVPGATDLSQWSSAMARARAALDEYSRIGRGVPTREAASIAGDWRSYAPPDPHWGIENVRFPAVVDGWTRRRIYESDPGALPLRLTADDDGGHIPAETVASDRLDPATIARLDRLETEAKAALREATALCGAKGARP